MFLQEAKFANQLGLLDQQTSLPLHIFGSNAGGGQTLKVKQFRIRKKSCFPSHLLKRRKARCGQGVRSRKALAQVQRFTVVDHSYISPTCLTVFSTRRILASQELSMLPI